MSDAVETEAHNDTGTSILTKLPHEIWSLVFEFVPFQNSVSHRVVSKWWKKNVDEFSTVNVENISDMKSPKILERIFELRIRSCGISNLRQPFEPKFAFPLLLKEITFGTNISSQNMMKLLSTCSNVESLSFFTTMSSDTSFQQNDNCVHSLGKLKNLKNIEIGIHNFSARNPTILNPTFETLIANDQVVFPALKKLSITFVMYHREWINLFNFIIRHVKTLVSLNIKCKCVSSQTDMDGILSKLVNTIDISKLLQINLKALQVQSDRSLCNNCKNEEVWMTMLSTQKCLEIVSTDMVPKLSFILDLVRRNVKSLKSVSFYDVYLELGDILDGSVFSQCQYLQILQLQFIPAYVVMIDIRDVGKKHKLSNFEFTGLTSLPKSLIKLSLQGCEMLTSDLIELSTQLVKLEELDLGPPGISVVGIDDNVGVSIEVLKCFCANLCNLRKFKLHKDILNVKTNTTTEHSANSSTKHNKMEDWSHIIETAKCLHIYTTEGKSESDDVHWCDTNSYEFNFTSDSRQLFVNKFIE